MSPHTSMKVPEPQCLEKNSHSTAGIHTNAEPPTGSSEHSAARTPNTIGEGRPTIAKPMAINTPCMMAVMAVPKTMARVTPLKRLNSRSLRSSPRGIKPRARAASNSPSRRKKNSSDNMITKDSSEPKAPRKNEPLTLAARCITSRVPDDQPGLHLLGRDSGVRQQPGVGAGNQRELLQIGKTLDIELRRILLNPAQQH